ncbi:MAG TPA: hypothetical protein VD835_00925 [Pyrinomonadaceae bacterium]|nr:hypothetical protein [Pyrinomonadaceae bacterium]
MVNARKKIKAEAQLAAFKHEQTLKDQCQSAIDQEKEKHRKELADKEKEIANLKGSHGGKTSDDSNSNSNFNSNSKSLPPGLRPPRG